MTDNLPRNSRTGEIQDTPLVDDLADVLSHMVVGWKDIIGHDLAQHPEVQRVMARYREFKVDEGRTDSVEDKVERGELKWEDYVDEEGYG